MGKKPILETSKTENPSVTVEFRPEELDLLQQLADEYEQTLEEFLHDLAMEAVNPDEDYPEYLQ